MTRLLPERPRAERSLRDGGAPGLQQVMGPGSLLRIPFGFSECPVWLWRLPEETGDPGCTVQWAEESEEDLEGLRELLWILP